MDLSDPWDRREFENTKATVVENRQRGLVPVKAYSVIEPAGELGHVHVASMAPATKEAFDEFMEAGCRWVSPEQQPHVYMVLQHIENTRAKLRREQ
jgi:hypothetical protein